MKTLLALFAFTGLAFAQATITIGVPAEANTTAVFSSEYVAAVQATIKAQPAQLSVGQTSTTLTQSTLVGDTTFNVATTQGVTAGMGVLLGGEVSLISSTTATTLTVVRARIGTTAVASSNGATLQYLNAGSYGSYIKNVLKARAQQDLLTQGGPSVIAAQAQILSSQSSIATAQTGAVQ